MSVELIGIICVGVILAGLILASRRDINLRLISLEQGLTDLRDRMASLEGILKGMALSRAERIYPD